MLSKVQVNHSDGRVMKMWYFENGQSSRIESFNSGNLRHGHFRSWYPNGELQFSGEYENDVQKVGTALYRCNADGTYQFLCVMYENGKRIRNNYNERNEVISSVTTVNDIKEGPYYEYRNGQVYIQTTYRDGKLNGQHVKYDSESNMVSINWYLDNVCVGPTLHRQGTNYSTEG
jgi:antitoxin component YwqK of YwqJK toxin-antitoxin module